MYVHWVSRHALVACLMLIASSFVPVAALAQPHTGLYVESQPGEPLGGGGLNVWTGADGTFTATRQSDNAIRARVTIAEALTWEFEFSAPNNSLLTVGTYANARRVAHIRPPGLLVRRDYWWCDAGDGRFVVHEISYAGNNTIQTLAADFEWHCDAEDPTLFGAIRINSSIPMPAPFAGNYPTPSLTIAPSSNGQVTGGGLVCGAGATTCSIDVFPPADVTLTATPASGYLFAGWTGACEGASTTVVRVNSRKTCEAIFESDTPPIGFRRLTLDSSPGDPIGGGKQAVYGAQNSAWEFPSPESGNSRTFHVNGDDGERWTIRIAAPPGATLQPGAYEGARDSSTALRYYGPRLDVFGNRGSCSAARGRFVVHEYGFDAGAGVDRFAVDFEYRCGSSPSVFGALRYYASSAELRPFGGSYPSYSLTVNVSGNGTVTGGGITCGTGGSTCSVNSAAGTSVALTATPDSGHVFAGWTGDCAGGSAVQLTIWTSNSCTARFEPLALGTPRTFLWIDSETGDVAGGGRQYRYSAATSSWSASGYSSVTMTVQGTDERWTLTFSAPTGSTLIPGVYENTGDFATAFRPGLSVSRLANGSGCTSRGRFVIYDVEFGSTDK